MGSPDRPLANVVTLGTRDFKQMRDFYKNLGWPQIDDGEDFAAFELSGTVLALFPADKLAADGRGEVETGQGGIRFTIGIMVESRDEVDQLAEKMRTSGGRVTKEPVDAEYFEGRSAYIADPEGNFWEIAWAAGGNSILEAARRAAGLPSKS